MQEPAVFIFISMYTEKYSIELQMSFSLEPIFFVSHVFLSCLGACLIFFENIVRINPDFFWRMCEMFENLVGNHWGILRNKWNFLRTK